MASRVTLPLPFVTVKLPSVNAKDNFDDENLIEMEPNSKISEPDKTNESSGKIVSDHSLDNSEG